MITFAILILIVAKALPGLNTQFSSIHVTRITSIVFLFAGALSLNCLNLECIGSGIGLYSGLFQVTAISQLIEIFLFTIGGGILIAWPQIKYKLASFPTAQLTKALPSYVGPESTVMVSDLEARVCKGGREKLTTFVLLTDKHSTDYSLVVLFSSLGSSLLISSYDLISVYLSIELQSFGLYVLSTLYRNSESSTSAGLKYFLLGGLSSCIILLGTGIIYSYTGTTNLESLYILNSVIDYNQQYIIQGISLGLILIFIGFLFKIAAAPLHNWSPDVYDGTPTIVTTWLTIIPKISILFILLELQIKLGIVGGLKTIIINNSGFSYAAGAEQNINLLSALSWSSWDIFNSAAIFERGTTEGVAATQLGEISLINNNILKSLLLISATLSLIVGSLLGLAQVRIKRLLAYSTISHIGFILLALAVNTEQSIDSFIFYIIQYTITNLNIFLVILGLTYFIFSAPLDSKLASLEAEGEGEGEVFASIPPYYDRNGLATPAPLLGIRRGYKDITYISEFKGYFFRNPLLSLSLAISLFSMAGIPPLIGFFSKQLVLYSALQNGYYFISVVAIIVSVISCSYYLQIIKVIFTSSSDSSDSYASKAFEFKSSSNYTAAGPGAHQPIKFTSEPIINIDRASLLPGRLQNTNKIDIIAAQPITNTHSYLISTLTFSILFFFIKPSLILNSTQLLSLSLFYI
jgi:NADH-ubiquinone oxidoreductase chain 2